MRRSGGAGRAAEQPRRASACPPGIPLPLPILPLPLLRSVRAKQGAAQAPTEGGASRLSLIDWTLTWGFVLIGAAPLMCIFCVRAPDALRCRPHPLAAGGWCEASQLGSHNEAKVVEEAEAEGGDDNDDNDGQKKPAAVEIDLRASEVDARTFRSLLEWV